MTKECTNDKAVKNVSIPGYLSVIRASSFVSCLGTHRWLRSNIQKHFRFPAAILFLDGEAMKRDRFHVRALLMTCVV
jgi:hypothetical protein